MTTPMMGQWHACKEKSPDTLLFFRLGDFYEAFYEDAKIMAKELDLTLTQRQDIPMAGVPHHMLETYLDRLIAKGHRVAIAEQIGDPKQTKGIVKRDIVRIVTPGTVITSTLLQDKKSNFLAAALPLNRSFGLALIDITTATFRVFEFSEKKQLIDELERSEPKELILPEKHKDFLHYPGAHTRPNWQFDHQTAFSALCTHFGVHTLDGFGLKEAICAINAAGALITYIKDDLNLPLTHLTKIEKGGESQFMQIDKDTQRHLELKELLQLLDQTKTPMGARLLKEMLHRPLLSCEAINQRQEAIATFLTDFPALLELRQALSPVRDLERIIMRIETGYASPRDLAALRESLVNVPLVKEALSPFSSPLIKEQVDQFGDWSALSAHLEKALVEAPPLRLSDGAIFKQGYHLPLDELYEIKSGGKEWIQKTQDRLRLETKIKTLKVGYTRAFGYYIDIPRAQSDKVPSYFQRRQTLVSSERYITEELKDFEEKILSADEKIARLQAHLFQEIKGEITSHSAAIYHLAKALAKLDALSALSFVAKEHQFARPLIDESHVFDVKGGRHPVIEKALNETFIPNDIYLDDRKKRLALITGPNMAGKSTYIRQAALIAILAQMGSFVPAEKAHIGLIDRLFTRIGASDDLARGQSTFMVEMTETASILHAATNRSLVLLDEIGRGTSTYDGISIAWAVAEYLLLTPGKRAKTLFATHYFEMAELTEKVEGAFNLHVSVYEGEEGITFLHKIAEGVADKSYGIHVARLAGLPDEAIKRAGQKLGELENKKPPVKPTSQLDLFAAKPEEDPLRETLKPIDPNQLTPIQALEKLFILKSKL